jgi:hypothetical protein
MMFHIGGALLQQVKRKDFPAVDGAPIPSNNALEMILEDGKLPRDQTLAEVRAIGLPR